MKIFVVEGDITKLRVEAIVNPANSRLTMGGGVALAIKLSGGEAIEEEAKRYGFVPVGKAIVTSGGNLPAKFVVHSPTMRNPGERIDVANVRLATKAALQAADELGIKEIAFPGMGTGVGGVAYEEAAKAMVEEIQRFKGSSLRKVILVARNESLRKAFEEALRSKGHK